VNDFLALYEELAVTPDCGLQRLRQAYRRRVGELHPDRPASAAGNAEALKALNMRYAAALEFHRIHARLPGEAQSRATTPDQGPYLRDAAPPAAGPRPATTRPLRDRRVAWLLGALALLVAWLLLGEGFGTPRAADPTRDATAADALHATRETEAGTALELGMTQGDVVALLGPPITIGDYDRHWQYGPSWLRFRCNRVADWYSSPLKPLAASHTTPREAPGKSGPARHPCMDDDDVALHTSP
jgi:hypothetical protein